MVNESLPTEIDTIRSANPSELRRKLYERRDSFFLGSAAKAEHEIVILKRKINRDEDRILFPNIVASNVFCQGSVEKNPC